MSEPSPMRALPPVHAIVDRPELAGALDEFGRNSVVASVRLAIEEARAAIREGKPAADASELAAAKPVPWSWTAPDAAPAGHQRHGNPPEYRTRPRPPGRRRDRGGRPGRPGLLQPGDRPRLGQSREPDGHGRAPAPTAHRRRGRDGRQQQRRRDRFGPPSPGLRPRSCRLARPAHRDRGELPAPRGLRSLGREAPGGRDDEQDPARRLRPRHRPGRRGPPPRPPEQLPDRRLHRVGRHRRPGIAGP